MQPIVVVCNQCEVSEWIFVGPGAECLNIAYTVLEWTEQIRT